MAKKNGAAKSSKSFEESLWETATKLRGSVESSEYPHVLGEAIERQPPEE